MSGSKFRIKFHIKKLFTVEYIGIKTHIDIETHIGIVLAIYIVYCFKCLKINLISCLKLN